MVTVTKYLTESDLKRKICYCEAEKLKVLFKEVNESELKINPEQGMMGAYILRNEKVIALCESCKRIYFITTTFEGGMTEQYISVDSVELFDGTMRELRQIINNIFDEYNNEIIDVVTDDHTIKVLNKYQDDEKIITTYAYLNREDKNLYRDLFEE